MKLDTEVNKKLLVHSFIFDSANVNDVWHKR